MAINLVQKRFMSSALQKWAYKLSGFNKYGLWRDDLLDECHEDVREALRRLSKKDRDMRNFRILRAVQLSLQKDILPKKKWTKIEDDIHYLSPLLDEVRKEKEEEEEWNKNF